MRKTYIIVVRHEFNNNYRMGNLSSACTKHASTVWNMKTCVYLLITYAERHILRDTVRKCYIILYKIIIGIKQHIQITIYYNNYYGKLEEKLK